MRTKRYRVRKMMRDNWPNIFYSKLFCNNILVIVSSSRKTESDDLDLVVQLDVFDDKKVADEEQFSGPRGVDLNNHIDVFHALFKQVRVQIIP